MHIDYTVSNNCINHYSYGAICVRCGCCSRNPDYRSRVINTIRYYKDCLNEEMNFDQWEENERWRKVQEKNIRQNILYYKRKIRMYKKIFRTLKKSY